MNVLLLADTHLGEGQGARLVDKLCSHLETADVIIHAGDITDSSVLTALQEFAPVHAVLGNNDRGMILPERLVVELDGCQTAS
jgi:putative phosphoesterase